MRLGEFPFSSICDQPSANKGGGGQVVISPGCYAPCPDPVCLLQPISLPAMIEVEDYFSKGSDFRGACIPT